MIDTPKLTARQQQILDLIQSAIARTGAPPTRAEIAAELGFKSANAAEEHLQALARKGVIELVSGTSRGIRLNSETLRSIHESRNGSWAFDLAWKPLAGFPAKAGWIRAIHLAQREVEDGLSIQAPVLVLHAERSLRPKKWSDDLLRADIVLDVEDIARLSPMLGPNVEVDAVPDGIHDLALAADGPRETAFRMVTDWLARVRQD